MRGLFGIVGALGLTAACGSSSESAGGSGGTSSGASGGSLAHDDVGGSSVADHFEGGALEGEATYDAVIDAYTVTGTFRGRWGMPAGATCEAGSPATCGAADVHGTFRLLHL